VDRADTTRNQLRVFARAVPFQPFVINMENGDRLTVEHPENVSFDPTINGNQDFTIVGNRLIYWSNLSAVSSLAKLDREKLPQELANGHG
jgi:hypothetical protein